jgi:hypothetical protein
MELLHIGMEQTITDNVIRALPSRVVRAYFTAVTATSVDFSNNSDMSNSKNMVPATDPAFSPGGIDVAAGFLRVNGGTAVINLVPY